MAMHCSKAAPVLAFRQPGLSRDPGGFYNCSHTEFLFCPIIPPGFGQDRFAQRAPKLPPDPAIIDHTLTLEKMTAPFIIRRQPLDTIHVVESERNRALARTIANIYIETTPVLIQVMRDAALQGNMRELFRTADALKASSANLGASQLAALCYDLTQLPCKQLLATVLARLDEISREAQTVCDALVGEGESFVA